MVPLLTMMWGHLQWGEAVRGPGLWAGSALGFLRGVGPVSESHSLSPPLGPWLKCCSVGSGWCQPLFPLGTPHLSWWLSWGVLCMAESWACHSGTALGGCPPQGGCPWHVLVSSPSGSALGTGVHSSGEALSASWPESWMLRFMTYSEGGDLRA